MRNLVAATVLLLSGCTAGGSAGSADCAAQVRVDETVYTSYGFTERRAVEHGTAEVADCDDMGADARGSVFTDDPELVTTWTFRGYPSTQVLGVRFDKQSYAVYIASSVSDAERDRILRELD